MRYALLICTEDKRQAELSEDEATTQTAAYMAWGEEMGGRGVLQGGQRLRPATTATTVRVREGDTLTSDGPFAETKEQLAGFYLVDATDLNDAIRIASKIPPAKHGSVEVRPVRELDVGGAS